MTTQIASLSASWLIESVLLACVPVLRGDAASTFACSHHMPCHRHFAVVPAAAGFLLFVALRLFIGAS